MRTSIRLGLIAFTVLNCSLLITEAGAQTKPTSPSTISGKVTIKGKPAPGIVVALMYSDGASSNQAQLPRGTTDQDGTYRISDVPSGTYTVQTAKPAYVQKDAQDVGKRMIVVGEGESIEEIDFELVRGGVITGKVTDSSGKPAVFEAVNIYKAEVFERATQQRQMPVVAFKVGQTDDRGIYRVYGLQPGKYKVAVGRGEDTRVGFTLGRNVRRVFYPDGDDQSKATILEVTEGGELGDIDLVLGPPITTFTASGQVIDGDTGLPIPDFQFGLQRFRNSQFPEFVNLPARTGKNGEFAFEGLMPGKYAIFLYGDLNPSRRIDSGSFEIVDQDVTGIALKLSKGSSISGTVIIDSDDKSIQSRVGSTRVHASVQTNVPTLSGNRSAVVSADGSFFLGGLATGTARILVGNQNGTLVVTRLERDGFVQSQDIEIKDGDQITGLRVFVVYGDSTLRGVLNFKNGTLPPGARMFIHLTPVGRPNMMQRSVRVDSRGHFVMDGLIEGVYELTGGITLTTNVNISSKQQVTVGPGTTDVSLMVDLSRISSPQPQQ